MRGKSVLEAFLLLHLLVLEVARKSLLLAASKSEEVEAEDAKMKPGI